MDGSEERDKRLRKEAHALKRKIDKRIEQLEQSRRILVERLKQFKYQRNNLVKICPFCGGFLNPYTQKLYVINPRTFECEECKKVFSIILRRIKKEEEL